MKITIEGFGSNGQPLTLDGVEEFVFFGAILEAGVLPRQFRVSHGNLDRLIGQGTRILRALEREMEHADSRTIEPGGV